MNQFKIKVTPEQSEIVQRTVFNYGWCGGWRGDKVVKYCNKPYLFVDNCLTYVTKYETNYFNEHKFKELTFDEFYLRYIILPNMIQFDVL